MILYYSKKEGILYTLIIIIIFLLLVLGIGSLYSIFKNKIHFFITGLDAGFSISDLVLLWQTAELCDLDNPTSLFFSLNALQKCMTQIQSQADSSEDKAQHCQLIMSKLFDYRTKIQNESDDKKGLNTTQTLEKGQKLRIILPGKGVFVSEIVNNGNAIVINVPKQNNLIPIPGEEWVNKVISVYLWRKGDARYVFDTTVTQHGLFLGKSALFLKHSANLVRTQKRKAIRASCQIYGNLYMIKGDIVDLTSIESQNGYKCLIEDISESGAQIRIGGKGVQNVKIKLQFNIQNKLIIMAGVIRSVEFNEAENQSLLHFECTHIEQNMRNEVLSYVYKMLPESEKEIFEAIAQTDNDSDGDEANTLDKSDSIESDLTETDAQFVAPEAGNSEDASLVKSQNYKSDEILPDIDGIAEKLDRETDIGDDNLSEEDELNIF